MVRGERVSVCVNRECEIASMEYEIVSTERGSAWYGLGKVGRGPLWSAKMKKTTTGEVMVMPVSQVRKMRNDKGHERGIEQ
jgi:hypothetical protein